MQPLQDDEHITMLRTTIRRFIENEMPRELARDWDERDYFPADVFAKLAELGVLGLTVPEEYGGCGPDIPATIAVIEELSSRSMAVCSAFIQATCYAGMNILEVGSEEQKSELLPKVVAGEMIFAYGITEPDVGSDIASVRTKAVIDGDEVVINGAKRFCSGSAFSNYIYTIVRSGPAEDRYKNLSIVLIPPDAPGITIEYQETMGIKGAGTADITFEDVRVPKSNIVGGMDAWNKGWSKIVGPGLDVEKIEVAAMALGTARAAVEDAWIYSEERIQFGKPISSIQSIRHMLAESKTKLEACRLMVYNAATLIGTDAETSVPTSMTKLFVTDTAVEIVLQCQRVMGAYGYVRECAMERYVRDALGMAIIGGSSAIQKNNICNRLKLLR
tara:strand:- start:1793 stop:2956 length:1164 start_codon:yes stop_codon:yes gene_type:complete